MPTNPTSILNTLTMHNPSRSQLISIFLVLYLIPNPVIAQREGFNVPDWAKHKLFSVSSDSLMLKHMLKQPGFNTSARIAISHIYNVEDNIIASLRNGTGRTDTQVFEPCTYANKRFGGSIKSVFGIRGLPDPIYDCGTDVIGTRLYTDQPPMYTTDAIFDAVAHLNHLCNIEWRYFVNNLLFKWPPHTRVLGIWTAPKYEYPPFFPWLRENKRCKLSGRGFMRVNQIWYFVVGISNVPGTVAMPHFQRQSLSEFVHVASDHEKTHSLRQRIPTYLSESQDGPSVDNTTTMFNRGRGLGLPSSFYPVYPEENPALVAAMADADRPIRQATDALTPSSLSIMFLPLVLNLVPVALITHVGTRVMLVYILVSDVMTVIPLMIKGLELIVTGTLRFRAVTTRIENDMSGMRGVAAAGQIWTAECSTKVDAQGYGIAFVAVSVAAMVVGIRLEIWARRFVARRGKTRAEILAKFMRIGEDETYETYDENKLLGSESALHVLCNRGMTDCC